MEEKKVRVLTPECFEILRIIGKMGIKKELVKLFKDLMNLSVRISKYEQELLEIADKKYKGDKRKAVSNNLDLATKYDEATAEQSVIGLEALFLIGENIPQAEQEVKRLIAKVHEMKMEEVEELEAFDLIDKIKEIVMCDSFARFFTSMAKLRM